MGYAVKSYFREIQLLNDDRVPLSGPVIFLPNHRSAFMDPIVVASYLKRRVHFLARGESFKNQMMAGLLGKLNVIPIYRKDKTPDDMYKNEETFKYCYKLLEEGGALVIFPEGASQSKPVLLPLKTGSARIALGAEAKNEFKLGVSLVPVGINYTNPHHFQGKLFLNFGRPIKAVDFREAYENDPVKAVQTLTAHIEDELKRRIVIVDDSRWQDLTDKVEQIVQSNSSRFEVEKEFESIKWFMARKDIAGAIEYFRREKSEELESLELRVQQYFSIIELLNLNEGTFNPLGKKQDKRVRFLPLLLYFSIGLPVFMLGYILHFIPFYLTNILAKVLVKKTDFIGSILLVLGLLLFSINGFTLTWLVFHWFQNYLIAIVFFSLLPSFGIFAFQYNIRLKRWLAGFRIKSIGNRREDLIKNLSKEKEELLKLFKSAHTDYLNNELRKAE